MVRLIPGDALEVLRCMDPGSVDAVITDPPYGIGLTLHGARTGDRIGERYRTMRGDHSRGVGAEVMRWAESAGLPVVAFADPQHPWPGDWRQHLVWDKGDGVGGYGDVRRTWKRTWELIQVARNGPLLKRRDSAVLRFPVSPGEKAHPAQKPVELLAYLIGQIVPPGGTVLDPFMGSGTTGVACVRTGRDFVGVEIDPAYFAVAEQRIASEGNRYPLFEQGRFA